MKFNSLILNSILFKRLIRQVLDYSFIILSNRTQNILNKVQKLQKRILKTIKFFPLKTSTSSIHDFFKINSVENRSNHLFTKFSQRIFNYERISEEVLDDESNRSENKRFKTLYDKVISCLNLTQSTSCVNNCRKDGGAL